MGSIRNRLLAQLLVTTTLTWAAAALWTYRAAHAQVDALLDAQLAQSARLLLAQAGHGLREAAEGDDDDDDDDREERWDTGLQLERPLHFQAWDGRGRLLYRSHARTPQTPLAGREPGFSDVMVDTEVWRVFSLWDRRQRLNLQVGQEHRVRQELAMALVTRALAPTLVGLLSTLLIMAWAVHRALQPLQRVAREVAARTPENLAPPSMGPVPDEVKPLTLALDVLLTRVQRLVDHERQFTSNAAHELRTPLAAIKAHAQVAEHAQEPAERQHALTQVARGVDRATHVVEQLLTLARLDPQRPLQGMGQVDVASVAQEVLADLAPMALAGGAEVALEGLPSSRISAGDATLLGTLLRNLVDNALAHGPRGGTVVVRVTEEEGHVVLAVEDCGPGIPVQERALVFERFHRPAGTTAPGSGLGLSIVKRIAELHAANVTLEDRAGGPGLRVVVRFPRS